MLADGDKGVVLQRDKTTYAVAPHLPCGLVTPAMLRRIADVADKYHAAALKCTSAQRIAIVGIREEDVDAVWGEFGEEPVKGHMTGSCVRSVKACPGTQFCKRARQDSNKETFKTWASQIAWETEVRRCRLRQPVRGIVDQGYRRDRGAERVADGGWGHVRHIAAAGPTAIRE